MFENISKGDFTTSIGGEFVVKKVNSGGMPIIQTFNKNGEDFENYESNAEFIAHCFNLQQRLDIGCYEEVINALENLLPLVKDNFSISRQARNMSFQSVDVKTQDEYNCVSARIAQENKEDYDLIRSIEQILNKSKNG